MGVHDVRLTGGEPLVRREFPRLAALLGAVPGVRDLSVTTNGFLLERDAAALVEAGINRFNVSVDSLQRDRFFEMTRRDALPRVLRGLETLAAFPEAHPIKINAVGMRGFTETEILPMAEFARTHPYEVRFIEFMPLDADHAWDRSKVLSGEEIRAAIDAVYPLEAEPREPSATARVFRFADGRARSGSSIRCPSRSAATATGSASRPRASCAPACSACTSTTCARRCATGRPTTSCARRSATPSGRRSSSTTSTIRASSSPTRTMSQIGG